MIVADTSVWIEHLRSGRTERANRLLSGKIWTHPFVIGEIALGQLHQHRVVLQALRRLAQSFVATDEEALHFIDSNALFGVGIGYVDVHLLAALRLTPGARLWTNDKRPVLSPPIFAWPLRQIRQVHGVKWNWQV